MSDFGQIVFSVAISQEAIVSDSDKAAWQRVKQEAPDKVNGSDGFVSDLVGLTIFEPEGDAAVFEFCEAGVGDGDSVGVASQVLKDMLGVLYGLAHTDDPVFFIEPVFELLVASGKGQLAGGYAACHMLHELAAKDHREGLFVKQVAVAWYPSRPIQ